MPAAIQLTNAHANNLRNVSLRIPHHQLIVVTGVSGSGKSSLAFDVIAREGQRRYLQTLPTFAQTQASKLSPAALDSIAGLSPVIAIGQRTGGAHARSTVGTLSGLYDGLRLLFARTGISPRPDLRLSRSLFSFNAEAGRCPRCAGIGREERIDLARLIAHPERSIREGALAPTLPTGYIMYSQVTIDVLDQVCRAEGFSVDVPWIQLSPKQQAVILYGSEAIKVPFGKHSLASRLKWTGIKAKPREEGFYKGLVPIMSDILRRDRNANILKYVEAVTCPACGGARLNADARSITVHGKTIYELTQLELHELAAWTSTMMWPPAWQAFSSDLCAKLSLLTDLGLGHLSLDRTASTLRPSEVQRIRIANQLRSPLSDVLYVLDEPSIGLHPTENARLLHHLRGLVRRGNTVIIVEHNLATIRFADHILEIGPGAGAHGGEVLYNGPLAGFLVNNGSETKQLDRSQTRRALLEHLASVRRGDKTGSSESKKAGRSEASSITTTVTGFSQSTKGKKPAANYLHLRGCHERNLRHVDCAIELGGLNVVSGPSGAGKSALVRETLLPLMRQHLGERLDRPVLVRSAEGLKALKQLVFVDHTPIGRTPRSNPATYLGISNPIRDLFASQASAKTRGFSKSHFSFNTKGGRCETCLGAGKVDLGMHTLGRAELPCQTCGGDRFRAEVLEVKYKGRSIAECYRLSVDEAIEFFAEQPLRPRSGQAALLRGLEMLRELGLGYLRLGQSSTTLSGGEAQRIKIANQLQRQRNGGRTLYVIAEPSIGLHPANVEDLLRVFDSITARADTIVCIEQHAAIVAHANRHLVLGPSSGSTGGQLLHQGTPQPIVELGEALRAVDDGVEKVTKRSTTDWIKLKGVTTHLLKGFDVQLPKRQLTVVTGRSGSGKSSLAYDTLYAEANARFTESLSPHVRSLLSQNSSARFKAYSGLTPTIGISRRAGASSPRSTVGTLSGVYDVLRLLYSRIAQQHGLDVTAQHFSFNHALGACVACAGLGSVQVCDPEEVIVAPELPLFGGALGQHKVLDYYTNENGQFVATLRTAAAQHGWDLSMAWADLPKTVQDAVLRGSGDNVYETTWHYRAKSRAGSEEIRAPWRGFCGYVNEEFARNQGRKRTAAFEGLLHEVACASCAGKRLKPELLEVQIGGLDISALSQLPVEAALAWALALKPFDGIQHQATLFATVLPGMQRLLENIIQLGLGHLALNRAVSTLSGGEQQRLLLAGQLATQLYGVTYVLDEPTIGLDRSQIDTLLNLLRRLIEQGNTVVVVEHDAHFIRQADYAVELGPGSGAAGGMLRYQGPLTGLRDAPDTLTYALLYGKMAAPKLPVRASGKSFGVRGVRMYSLDGFDAEFQAGQLTAVTGASGSGKSTLLKVLWHSWRKGRPINCEEAYGLDQFTEVVLLDQAPLPRARLSTPASVTGVLGAIQRVFSKHAKAGGAEVKPAAFSYLSARGKCPECVGHGAQRTAMDFLSDVWLPCSTCGGLRYSQEVLAHTLRGMSVGEVLTLTVSEALAFFKEPVVKKPLALLDAVGLSHLRLGQAGTTLSGGEAQRLKLARTMLSQQLGATLYIFDEPSAGLHRVDMLRLLEVFEALLERGDTVVYAEHDELMIEAAGAGMALG